MHRRSLRRSAHEKLGPWETKDDSDEENDVVAFCDQILPPLLKTKK